MTHLFRVSLILLLLTGGQISTPAIAAPQKTDARTGTVTWVYDADTLELAPQGKVRLLGIDAPEKAASDRDRNFTKLGILPRRLRAVHGAGLSWCIHNIKGQQVTLTFDSTQRDRYDRHGRLLAYVHLPDGRLLNRLLLETGLVIVYRRFPFDAKTDFLAAEAEAKARGTGLWAH